MDLGYSSSSSSSSLSDYDEIKKEDQYIEDNDSNKEKNNEIDITKIFDLAQPAQKKRKIETSRNQTIDKINETINKIINDKIELDDEIASTTNNIESEDDQTNDSNSKLIPKDAQIKELNMDEFYLKNKQDIESGELDSNRQDNSGNITFHRGNSTQIGRLDNVIRFNINNKDKITFQNKEKIAKEHEIAKERFNSGHI